MPDVPKISAGYYAKPGMDLVDLFVGAEGTLGVVAEAKLKVLPEPPAHMAMINCESDDQALDLIIKLHNQNPGKSLEPGGVSAVELVGTKTVQFVDKNSAAQVPAGAGSLLFVQLEGDESDLFSLAETCQESGIDLENIYPDEPEDEAKKAAYTALREAAPLAVNEQIARLKSADRAVTKISADPCVQPDKIGKMIKIYDQTFRRAGLEYYFWGHGKGNLHFNALPTDLRHVELAKLAILNAGKRVTFELAGTGMAEHGVGKNPVKQALLIHQYGASGIEQMRAVKQALDPDGVMAPGNIFPANKS
jgi:D-lactate dehydrogenase (cytochrome)